MLVCQMLAKPAQILSYNSLANLQLYDLYMIWLLMCWADAMLAGFVVVVSFFSQVWLLSCLSSSLCKNSNEFYVGFVYSSLLVFWTPTCRAESIFATTAFSQLMMLLSERGFAEKVDVLAKPVFPFYLFSISKSVIFFSPVVLEICITTGRIFYKKKNHINSLQHEEKERKEPK